MISAELGHQTSVFSIILFKKTFTKSYNAFNFNCALCSRHRLRNHATLSSSHTRGEWQAVATAFSNSLDSKRFWLWLLSLEECLVFNLTQKLLSPFIREFLQVASDCDLSINVISGTRLVSCEVDLCHAWCTAHSTFKDLCVHICQTLLTDIVPSEMGQSCVLGRLALERKPTSRNCCHFCQIHVVRLTNLKINEFELRGRARRALFKYHHRQIPSNHFSYCQWQNLDERNHAGVSQTCLQNQPHSCVFPGPFSEILATFPEIVLLGSPQSDRGHKDPSPPKPVIGTQPSLHCPLPRSLLWHFISLLYERSTQAESSFWKAFQALA